MAYDKIVDSSQLNSDLTSVANAIRAKSGGSSQLAFPSGFVSEIGNIPTGVTSAPFNDVNFYDKDGSIVYSYTKAEFLALESLPANPSHDGLIAQGWNWTLAGAKAFVNKYGILDVGQTYITNDGATRITIWILDGAETSMCIYWTQNKNDGVKVNWGDGSAIETVSTSGTGVKYLGHNYATVGQYVISLMPDDDCTFSLGNSGNYAIWGAGNSSYNWAEKIIAVNYGKNVETNTGPTFGSCDAIKELTISKSITALNTRFNNGNASIIVPYGVTTIENTTTFSNSKTSVVLSETVNNSTGTFVFSNNSIITRIVLPDGLTALPNNIFSNCYSLQQCTFPSGLTQIGSSAFSNCYALAKIIVPSSVTSIGAQAFNLCRGCKEYYLYPTTPPTLDNSNAFTNTKSDMVIYVPYSADHSILETYKTATNWLAYASYMQEMEP